MNAVPPSFRGSGPDPDAADATSERWVALIEAARLVAVLAGEEAAPSPDETGDFLLGLERAEAWRREQVEHAVADLVAIMEPGLAALLAIGGRGADPRAAAQALWREFAVARGAIRALLSPLAA